MRLTNFLCALSLCLGQIAFSNEVTPIDLKPFVGHSPFDIIKADWLLPRGQHVYDGIPWKIDGAILLYGNNAVQKKNPARTNVNDIPVGQKFETLHLLAATQQNAKDGVTIAKIHLNYTDGTDAILDIKFGTHVRYYIGPWHRADQPIKNKNVHQAWHAQFGPSANHDEYLRLFHVPLTNPNPTKEVRSISLESNKKAAALMVVAMSVGPSSAAPLPSESLGHAPFPDLRKRTGEPATAEGFVYTTAGKPIADAIVKVVAARQFGNGHLDESDNGASTTSDSRGHFALPNLPDDNAYRVLIVAPRYALYVYHGIDAKSDPVQVRLEPETNHIGKFVARARLVDMNGKPIPNAIVARDGVGYGGGGMSWGDSGFPEYMVSDTDGEFTLSRDQEFTRIQIKVTSPNLAPLKEWIPVTNTVTALEMGVGVTVHGRVLDRAGKPLPHIELGITGTDRNAELFAGTFHATTDSEGVFDFKNVMPRVAWNLYGTLNSCRQYGALPARKIMTAQHNTVTNIGDLQIVPAVRLSGQIKTVHGEPLPKNMKLHLTVADEADSENCEISKDGGFEFTGLYPSRVTVFLETDQWKLSGHNYSLSFWNPWQLVGMIEKDKTNLIVAIENGGREYQYEDDNGNMPGSDDLTTKVICGIENIGSAIVLAGSIVDDTTGQPIAKCKIVPGYKPSAAAWGMAASQPKKSVFEKLLQPLTKKHDNWYEKTFWMPARAEQTTNGTFAVPFVPLQSTPMMRVEAKGYEPYISDPIAFSTNNLVIRLRHGNGPSGTVLLPDGKPAAKAKVLFATGSEQYGLDGRELDLYGYQTNAMALTKTDGTFAFLPRANPARLYFAHQSGYAEVALTEKDQKVEVRLKPWAALTGALVKSNGTPASNVELNLTFYNGYEYDGNQPLLNGNQRVKTDSKGTFLFTNVPPRRVQVERIVPSGRSGWTSVLQTWADVEPGITNNLGKITYDSPPAKSVLEQLKEKFGVQ